MNASMKQIMKATTGMTEMASELYRYDSKQEIQHSRKVRCWRKTALLNKQMMQLLVKADEDESIKSKSRRGSISSIRRRLQNVEEENRKKQPRASRRGRRRGIQRKTPFHKTRKRLLSKPHPQPPSFRRMDAEYSRERRIPPPHHQQLQARQCKM